MPRIWGHFEGVDRAINAPAYLQVKIVLAGGAAIRMRPVITDRTLIARGTRRIDLATLRTGEMVELTYRNQAGRLEAETIHVRPDYDGAPS